MNRMKSGALLLGLFALAACTDTVGPDTIEDTLTEDVAMIMADAVIDGFGDLGLLFGGGAALASGGPSTRSGTHTATFYNELGVEQATRDPLLTASIHLVIQSTHEFSRDSWSATGSRSRDLMITGLLDEETSRTVNGTGSGTVSRSRHTDDAGTRTYDMSSTSVIENVVHPVPRTDDAWPLSGTITRNVTATIVEGTDEPVTRNRTGVVTFNGTNLVTLTVDGEIFEIDLSTRSDRRPFRRRGQ